MEQWERDGMRSTNFGMRNQVDHILDALAQQQAQASEVYQQLAAVRATATSADGTVTVTVTGSGTLTAVQFTPEALHSTPERLGRSVVEAGQEAARRANEQNDALTAPMLADADAMPDLPDLVPGAPSLRELREPWRREREEPSSPESR